MDMRKKLLGAEHPDTLSSMGNLASTYQNHCYDFRRLGNRRQSKVQKYVQVLVQMSLEECKFSNLYCLARFERELRSRGNCLLKTSYRTVVSTQSLYTVPLLCMSKQRCV
jgi:hypothetical protein